MAFSYNQTPTRNAETISIGSDIIALHWQGIVKLSNYIARYRRRTLLCQALNIGHEFKAQAETYTTVFTAQAKTSPNPSDLGTTLSVGIVIRAKRLSTANGDIQIVVDGQTASFTVDNGTTDDTYQTTTLANITHDSTITITGGIKSDTSGDGIRLSKILIYELDLSA